jgi:hypothetical protein
MPSARYGAVLADMDVVVGKWDLAQNCPSSDPQFFCPVPAGTSCVSFGCNSVKVTTRRAAANNNALNLTFGSYVGIPTFNVSASAIAVYGNDPGAPTWNAIITMDVSGSFTDDLPQGKAAAQGLLNCMHDNAPSGSKLGITLFAGCSGQTCSPQLQTFRSMLSTSQGNTYNQLTQKISQIAACQNNATNSQTLNSPMCSTNTSQASGIKAAFDQFCPTGTCAPSSTSKNAMVIISDGLPVSSSANMCGGSQCTAQQLKDMAVAQADTAAAQGIDIYTIYYGSDTAGRDFLATLRRGNGIALDTPNPVDLATLMSRVCATALVHRLVW